MQNAPYQSKWMPAVVKSVAKNLSATGRGRKQIIGMCVDTVLVIFSLWAAYALRYGSIHVDIEHLALHFFLLPPVTILIFGGLGVYRWVVRSSSISLFFQLTKGALASSMALLVLLHLLPIDGANPRSVFIIYGLVLGSTCSALRMIWKALFSSDHTGAPVAIFGAGSAGKQLAEILNRGVDFHPACFIDDDDSVVGSTIMGRPVLNGRSNFLKSQLLAHEVTQVIIAIPSVDSAQYSDVYERLEKTGIPFKTSPSFVELISGQSAIGEIREVSVSDILGRNEVVPDPILLKKAIKNKSILVTGGGGSIGSELCRQILMFGPSRLTVLDNCEANLYHINEEITEILTELIDRDAIAFNAILCSVTDKRRVSRLLREHHYDTIFHAAAYKHVPMVERFPEQGIEVNVFGTLTMVEAAIEHDVNRFVLISTDKAVRPTNAMGATKRVAELILQAKAQYANNTILSMVRFGNVLASNGSVVPKFRKQIAAGGPVTLTDPGVTRYFMTIPEASQLVIQASSISQAGDVFVLDMGEPIKISQLAETMIRLYSQQVELAGGTRPDIKIEVTGLRPGEKMFEELFIDSNCEQTSISKVMSANEQFLSWDVLEPLLHELKHGAAELEAQAVKQLLFSIVFHNSQKRSAKLQNSTLNLVVAEA